MGSDFTFRLVTALELRQKTPYSLAQMLGLGTSTVLNWVPSKKNTRRVSVPEVDTVAAIADALDVSVEWLVAGRGEMERRVSACLPVDQDFALIPRLSVEASAGGGSVNHGEEVQQMLAFRRDWLHRLGLSTSSAKALTVRGDSMYPTLRDGDLVLVDTAVEHVDDAGIFVVGVDDRVLVKRIQPKYDGSLALISENAVYAPEEVPAEQASRLRILGRVRWFGRAI